MPIKLGSTSMILQDAILKVMLGAVQIYPETPAGPVNYTITEIDSLEHVSSMCADQSVCLLKSGVFVLAYRGDNLADDGYVKTFSVDGNYEITEIDSIEFDSTAGGGMSVVRIDDTHFIIAYNGDGSDGYIKTFSVDANADNITNIDTLEHDTTQGTENSLVKIDATHYALAYAGSGSDGYLATFSIDANADNITEIASIEHDVANGTDNSLVLLDSTHLFLAYTGDASDGFVKTFSFDGSYGSLTQIDSLEHASADGLYSSCARIDATHVAVAFAGTSGDGFVRIFTIDGSYDITQTSSLEHDTADGTYNSLVLIDEDHLMLAYRGTGTDAYLKTFGFDGSYALTQIDSEKYTTVSLGHNALLQLDSIHYALGYSSGSSYGVGQLKTFSID